MPTTKDLVTMESGPFTEADGKFTFTARSISEDFVCEYLMEILAEQSIGAPLVFRHRHPADQTFENVPPIFGRVTGAKIVDEDGKKFLRCEYAVPTRAPNGKELQENVIFAQWVRTSYEEGNPVGISLHFVKYLEDGVAYWADLIEHTSTHVPACSDCLNIGVAEKLEESNKAEDKVKKMTSKELEDLLERRTLEKEKLEKRVEELEGILSDIDVAKAKQQATQREELEEALVKLSKEHKELARKHDILEDELAFYKSPARDIIERLVKLEGNEQFREFYRGWLKQDGGLELLEKRLEKLEQPVGLETSNINPSGMIDKAARSKLEDAAPTKEEIVKNVDPSLRESMKEFLEGRS